MTYKVAGIVLFLIALQAIPLLTFIHAHPTDSLNRVSNQLDNVSHDAMTQTLNSGNTNADNTDHIDNTQRF